MTWEAQYSVVEEFNLIQTSYAYSTKETFLHDFKEILENFEGMFPRY